MASATFLVAGYVLLPLRGGQRWVGLVTGAALIGLAAATAVRRFRRIQASDRPIVEALEGLLLVATLVIVGFAAVYYTIAADTGQFAGLETRIDSLYFTVVTAATVGYGDITPIGQWPRAIVTLQIVVNVIVIGIVVRAFTAVARSRRDELG